MKLFEELDRICYIMDVKWHDAWDIPYIYLFGKKLALKEAIYEKTIEGCLGRCHEFHFGEPPEDGEYKVIGEVMTKIMTTTNSIGEKCYELKYDFSRLFFINPTVLLYELDRQTNRKICLREWSLKLYPDEKITDLVYNATLLCTTEI